MDAVAILRQLWSHRLLVAVGIALALVVGTLIAYRVTLGFPPGFESRQYQVGIASAEVLVDSPRSQVADLGGGQAITDVTGLVGRARLLASLMAISPLKDQIARRAGVDPRTLIATAPSAELAVKKPSALDSAAEGPGANRLTINFNDVLPIITANAQAASSGVAARISSAAVEELRAYLKTIAATDNVPDARQLVIRPLGPARYTTVSRGPRRLFAVIASVLLSALWCAGTVVGLRLARSWREQTDAERHGRPGPSMPGVRPEPVAIHLAGGAVADRPVSNAPSARKPTEGGAQALPERPERPERPMRRGTVA